MSLKINVGFYLILEGLGSQHSAIIFMLINNRLNKLQITSIDTCNIKLRRKTSVSDLWPLCPKS